MKIAEFLKENRHHLTDPKHFDWIKNAPKFDANVFDKIGNNIQDKAGELSGLFGRGKYYPVPAYATPGKIRASDDANDAS